jgi:uncharacterized protein (TIGR02646 family)
LRHIDTSSLPGRLPTNWVAKATAALDKVRKTTTPQERAEALRLGAPVWHALKEILASLSGGKCWYCEAEQARSDNNVDHFRPKGEVAEASCHGGYWWLAFSLDNFRFSCTFCNSRRKDRETKKGGGKQDHFPLFDEKRRACKEDDPLANERPKLLDPTTEADPGLLWFEPDGRVIEYAVKTEAPDHHERANVSITLYHLNESKLVNKRKDLCNEIVRLIQEGDQQYREYLAGNAAGALGYESVLRRLRQRLRPQAEYTATAMAMVLANIDAKNKWLRAALSGL